MFFSFSLGSGWGREMEKTVPYMAKWGGFLALHFCPDVSILAGKVGADCVFA